MGKIRGVVKSRSRKIILPTNSPCPCGSGKIIRDCHLDIDGQLRKPRPSLKPPRKETGHSHSGCYLKDTYNCSRQISREHYISRSVLEQLGTKVRVSGVHWLSEGESFNGSVESLTAKILCDRHNNALSPLDNEAGLFFSILKDSLIDLDRKTLSRQPIFHLIGGEALELWMLKVACGVYFSIGSHDKEKLSNTHTINMEKVTRAFFDDAWNARAGLYFRGNTGSVVTVNEGVGFAPLVMDSNRHFGGVTISLLGFELDLLFDTAGANPGAWTSIVRRPTELVLSKKRRQHSIILTWPAGTPEASLRIEQRPKTKLVP